MASARKRRAASEVEDDHDGKTEVEDDIVPIAHYPIPEIPPEVLFDILSRLPVKSVFICRRVCKLWLSLTSGSEFAKLHLSRSQVSLLVRTIDPSSNPSHLRLIDLTIAPFVDSADARMKLTPNTNLPGDPQIAVNFLNSCNGLLCSSEPRMADPVYVFNPILGEYITLPKCDSATKFFDYRPAFGFSPKTNQYKVVRFILKVFDTMGQPVTNRVSESELMIYTLGEGSWRSIGEFPQCIFNGSNSCYTFLNGATHWLTKSRTQPELICCFDFDTEQLRAVSEPSELAPLVKERVSYMNLGVLRNCLSICDLTNRYRADIWLMKDYGVKESWSKHIVIDNFVSKIWQFDYYEPVMILESGQVLIRFNTDTLFLYDPKLHELRNVHVYGSGKDFSGILHIPSFVSLRDVARGEDVQMCRT